MSDMACQIQRKTNRTVRPGTVATYSRECICGSTLLSKELEGGGGGGGGMVVNLNCNHMKSYVYRAGNRADLKIYYSPRPLGSNCESKYIKDTTQGMKA